MGGCDYARVGKGMRRLQHNKVIAVTRPCNNWLRIPPRMTVCYISIDTRASNERL
jgi:hypothetical protein